MKLDFDEINPVFYLSKANVKSIKEIENLLAVIKIDKKLRISARKKAQVRSIHSSLAIEANSLSLEEVNDIYENRKVLAPKKDVQEVKNAIELYKNISKYNWRKEKDLNKAHSLLMKYFDEDNGKYRNHGEGVKRGKKIVYRAPESLLVPGLMDSLFKYCLIPMILTTVSCES